MKLKKAILIIVLAMIVCANSVKSYGQQDTRSNAQNDAVTKACREAVAEVVSLREREAILKKTVEELKRVGELKDERLGLLEKAIAEYEKAVEARIKAESVVEELRKNWAAQVAAAEKESARQSRRANLWRGIAAILAAIALITGTRK